MTQYEIRPFEPTPEFEAYWRSAGKRYRVAPCEVTPRQYKDEISERYSDDYGKVQTRTTRVVVSVDVPPLHTGAPAQRKSR